jgi:hypothetical protein
VALVSRAAGAGAERVGILWSFTAGAAWDTLVQRIQSHLVASWAWTWERTHAVRFLNWLEKV